ncbi:hypothetical protein [Chryseobacterium camelliae]|uniref:hypothetical protein n=1 Tax=Chryseobacterium camelliae TaxID=1265445 RepID=UPI000C1CB9F0|nr:hypothetical protein [Chryseobacterium camelliae]
MKGKNLLFFIILSYFWCFSLSSCSHEPLENETVEAGHNPLSYIKNTYLQDKNIILGKNILWENARTYQDKGNLILITVPIKSDETDLIEELTFRIDNNKITGHLWKFKSDTAFSIEDYFLSAHKIMEKMSGTVSYIALEGSFRYKKRIVNGQFIEEVGKGGSGPMDSPACKKCHGSIDEVVIPPPSGGGPTNPTPPPIPPPVVINPPSNPQEDPCKKAEAGSKKASDIAKDPKFSSAKQGVLNGLAQNGGENGVGFGVNSPNGPLQSTGVQPLGATSGNVNNPFNYPTADMHNHPQNTPPSAGDVYSMMTYASQHSTFGTRYVVLPDGTVYALTVTNAGAFANFLSNYPPSQVPGFAPNFSGAVYTDWDDAYFYSNAEIALSYVLDKYNTGIALTKMDSNGNFKKVNATNNGNNSYSQSQCP